MIAGEQISTVRWNTSLTMTLQTTVLCDCQLNVSESANVSASSFCPCANANDSTATTVDPALQNGNPFILVWYQQLIYIVLFVSMVLVAAGGNLIVIWIVVAHKRMRTVTNYFLVNLAIADALISLLSTPFCFVYMLYGHWPFGKGYCKFSTFVAHCAIAASVFTFMAISIDRYMAIIHPLKPRMSARFVLAVVALMWLSSGLVSLPNILISQTHTFVYTNGDIRTICFPEWPDGEQGNMDFAYSLCYMSLTYFVPLVALGVTYIRVGMELWGSRAIGELTVGQAESIRAKRRVVKMLMVVVLIFAVCWLPQHVYFLVSNLYQSVNEYEYTQHIYLVIYWLAMSNSMYNPIIYCWMNARFRRGFKQVFQWLLCRGRGGSTSDKRSPMSRKLVGGLSMTENTTRYGGFDANGSLMHTCVESMAHDEKPLTAIITRNSPHRGGGLGGGGGGLTDKEEAEDTV